MDRKTTVFVDIARANPKSQSCNNYRIYKLSATSKQTPGLIRILMYTNNLNNRTSTNENVLWFHVAMDDAV